MKTLPSTLIRKAGFLTIICLALGLSACSTKQSQLGVENKWRNPAPPSFEKGRTTQSDVMRQLGPPSQVIALHDQTLFYYLREQFESRAMLLIIYNRTRERITYDRAIFFFNKDGVLTDFALSDEHIQP
jgi:outer membrane protein assembly factor BamE (lipoprotein component of BamABCDE complex)